MLTVNGKNIKRMGKTLLDTLKLNGFSVHEGCREGYCGNCRCKKVSGDVALLAEPLAFHDDNEIIPCVSKTPDNGDLEILV